MKKTVSTIIMFAVFFLVSFCFVFAQGKIAPLNWDKPVNPVGTTVMIQSNETATTTAISEVSGDVKVISVDGSQKDLSAGEPLKSGDTITTGNKGGFLKFFSGTEISVGLFVRFTFVLGEENADALPLYIFDLDFGLIRINFKTSLFSVKTPTASITPKGTDFIVGYDADKKITDVYLHEGLVSVDNLHGTIIQLQAGETAIIDTDGKITTGKLAEGQWEQLAGKTGPGTVITTETDERSSNKTIIFALIAATIFIVCAGIFFYQKKS